MDRFFEPAAAPWGQFYAIDRLLLHERTDFAEIRIFENAGLGRVLVIDGAVQLATAEEHIYHEMLAHVPMCGHDDPHDVLIIGGGDGGTLREVLKHNIRAATLVEIDPKIISVCEEYFPNVSAGAFHDNKAEIIIGDGAAFVASTDKKFDVVIVDGTDPGDISSPLYASAFYAACRRVLRTGGLFVTHLGADLREVDLLLPRLQTVRDVFPRAWIYEAPLRYFTGGALAFVMAGRDSSSSNKLPTARSISLATRYYNSRIYECSIALAEARLAGIMQT